MEEKEMEGAQEEREREMEKERGISTKTENKLLRIKASKVYFNYLRCTERRDCALQSTR